ncbi:MAG TPA: putative Ig domain-containing protein [Chthoniobacterales bacterium]|nr:putative Ig domain-containing protein [Chthoniobacterales bacterium]
MFRRRWLRFLFLPFCLLASRTVESYTLLGSSWPAGSQVPLELRLGAAPYPLRDGSMSFDASALVAMNMWNAQAVKVQLASAPVSEAVPRQVDGVNSVFFSHTVYGEAFGSRTLAVAVRLSSGGVTTEADVIFNQSKSWDSYTGALPPTESEPMDLRRVALHEFGHVLGLAHPDRAGEFVNAIMYSRATSLSQLTPDDVAGLDALYGAKFTIPTAVTAVVGEPFSMEMTVDTPVNMISVSPEPTGLRFNAQTRVLSGTPAEDGTFNLTVAAYIKNYTRQISQPLAVTVLPRQRNMPTFFDFIQLVRFYNTERRFYFTPASGLKVVLNDFNRIVVTAGSAAPVIFFGGGADNALLTPGVYENAVRDFALKPGQHYLDVSGTINQCDGPTGRFVVKQITYGLRRTITSFWATFEQDCASGVRVHNRGEIRFHVDPDDPLPVPKIEAPPVFDGTQGQPISFRVSSQTASVRWDASGLPRGMFINAFTGEVSGTPTVGGTFRVKIFATDADGRVGEGAVTITIAGTPPPPHSLVNISTRSRSGTGEDATIAGFIISGTNKKGVLVRVLGPSLADMGVAPAQVLADPVLVLHGLSSPVTVDDWGRATTPGYGPFPTVAATGLSPSRSVEAATYQELTGGSYSVVVGGKNGSGGIALTEVYDIDPDLSSLRNISSRARVGVGDDVLIGGFIIGGGVPTRVVVRGIGPSLASAGVTNPLVDPTLTLHNSEGAVIESNDNWRSEYPQRILDTGIPPSDDREAAIVTTLQPGSYTAIVRGRDETTGIGLVEIYNLDK